MIDHEPLQMRERLVVVAARHLELREPQERVLVARGERVLDDDAPEIALRVCRRRRDHRAPVQRVDVARRAGDRDVDLVLHERARRVALPFRRHALGANEDAVRALGGRIGVERRSRLCRERSGAQEEHGE